MISEAGAPGKHASSAYRHRSHHEKIALASPKQTQQPTRASGIYQIRCKANGKIYIGSAVHIPARWHQHRHTLRQGKHRNRHLQGSWNKYGEDAFEFTVLAYVEPADLLRTEQEWIDKTRCADQKVGFNLYARAGSPGDTFAQTWEGFIDPDGNEVTITNLHLFCHQQSLNFAAMAQLAKGKSKLKSHKGWTHKNSVRQRDYIKTHEGFIAPDGYPVGPIVNLAAFCRERGLDDTHMLAVANGRICSHRGWTHRNGRLRQEMVQTGFINPDGERVIITNLQAFCRAQGLKPVRMHQLKNGQRKSHKGWTWRENNE